MAQPEKKQNGEMVPCPLCGQEIKAFARVCKWCGSDENTGWSNNTYLDGISLPGDEDEYEELKQEEFGTASSPSKKRFLIPVIALGLLILFILGVVRGVGCH